MYCKIAKYPFAIPGTETWFKPTQSLIGARRHLKTDEKIKVLTGRQNYPELSEFTDIKAREKKLSHILRQK